MTEDRIVAALRALAHDSSTGQPSARIEEELLAAFDAHHARGGGSWWGPWLAAAAAVAVVAAGLALAQLDLAGTPDLRTGAPDLAAVVETSEFVAWPGAAALPAFESGHLVRTELPVSVLPLLGIPQADAPAGDRVVADVLYAQDGLARAVRIVRDRSMNP